jgi:hypothetical protein
MKSKKQMPSVVRAFAKYAEKADLSKTLSLAFFSVTDAMGTSRKEMSIECLQTVEMTLVSAFVCPLSVPGTAGCPAGEEGCQDSVYLLLA